MRILRRRIKLCVHFNIKRKIRKMFLPCKINPALFSIRIFYFLSSAGSAAIMPYLPLFAKQLGFNKAEVGLIYGIFPFILIISNVVIGIIADKIQQYKLVLMILLLAKTFSLFPLYYLSPLQSNQSENINLFCQNEELYLNNYLWNSSEIIQSHDNNFKIFCNFSCDVTFQNYNYSFFSNIPLQSTEFIFNSKHSTFFATDLQSIFETIPMKKCQISNALSCNMTLCNQKLIFTNELRESTFRLTYQFVAFLVLNLVTEIALSGGIALADAIALEQLKENSLHYGKIRLMGSLGYGICCLIFGYAFDAYSEGEPKIDYLIGFFSSAGLFALSAIIVGIFFKADLSPKTHHLLRDMKQILSVPRTLIFLIFVWLDGVFHSFCATYFLWFLDDIGGTHALLGWAIFTSCVAELPFLFFSGKIIKLFGSNNIMYLVFITWGIRIILYTVIEVPWGLIPVELLHGIAFGLFYANMAANVKDSSTPGTLATNQEIHFSVFRGIGAVAGNMFGGFAFEKYGARQTFRGFAVVAFLSAVVYFIINTLINYIKTKKQSNYKKVQSEKTKILEEQNPITKF